MTADISSGYSQGSRGSSGLVRILFVLGGISLLWGLYLTLVFAYEEAFVWDGGDPREPIASALLLTGGLVTIVVGRRAHMISGRDKHSSLAEYLNGKWRSDRAAVLAAVSASTAGASLVIGWALLGIASYGCGRSPPLLAGPDLAPSIWTAGIVAALTAVLAGCMGSIIADGRRLAMNSEIAGALLAVILICAILNYPITQVITMIC